MKKLELKALLEEKLSGEILYDEPMKNHTSFRIGGPVDVMIIPKNEIEIINTVETLRANNIDFMVMGNGSNLLVKDSGIRGVVVKIGKGFNDIKVNGNSIINMNLKSY